MHELPPTLPIAEVRAVKRKLTSIDALVRYNEGCRLSPYICPTGHLTVGWGHSLEAHPLVNVQRGHKISQAEADAILGADIARVRAELHRAIPWYRLLDAPRQVALEDMAFQMGVAGLLEFKKTLAHLKAGDFEAASVELLRSKYAEQTPERATRIAGMVRLNEFPEV